MNRGKVTVCFRFDDPSAISEHALEAEILALLADFGAKITVAAVPFAGCDRGVPPLKSEDVPHLLEQQHQGTVEIALHGYSHARVSVDDRGVPSEFFGRPLAEQKALLEEGKTHLEKVFNAPVTGFVPPWNTHDRVTLQTASELGFGYISVGQVNAYGTRYGGLFVLPKTCALREQDVLSVIGKALKVRQYGPVVVFVMHAYNFAESEEPRGEDESPPFLSLPTLRSILESISAIGEGLEFATIADVVGRIREQGGYWNAESLRGVGKWSYRLARRLPAGYLVPYPRYRAWAAIANCLWG